MKITNLPRTFLVQRYAVWGEGVGTELDHVMPVKCRNAPNGTGHFEPVGTKENKNAKQSTNFLLMNRFWKTKPLKWSSDHSLHQGDNFLGCCVTILFKLTGLPVHMVEICCGFSRGTAHPAYCHKGWHRDSCDKNKQRPLLQKRLKIRCFPSTKKVFTWL